MRKKKIEKCCICHRLLDGKAEHIIKVKEKILYEDADGIWYNFIPAYICSCCIMKIRQEVKAED